MDLSKDQTKSIERVARKSLFVCQEAAIQSASNVIYRSIIECGYMANCVRGSLRLCIPPREL